MSGEALPLTAPLWDAEASEELKLIHNEAPMEVTASIAKAVSNPSFSPYEKLQWLTDAPVGKAESKGSLNALLILDKRNTLPIQRQGLMATCFMCGRQLAITAGTTALCTSLLKQTSWAKAGVMFRFRCLQSWVIFIADARFYPATTS